jgi:hypothetical protein
MMILDRIFGLRLKRMLVQAVPMIVARISEPCRAQSHEGT